MRRIPPLLLVLFLVPSVAHAQDDAYAPAASAHAAGRWSMQYEIGNDFQLLPFEGAALAVTKNTSSTAAWRLGILLALDVTDGTTTVDSISSGLNGTSESTVTREAPGVDRYTARFDLVRLKRYHPDRRVGLELGIGPRVSFDRTSETRFYSNPAIPGHQKEEAKNQFYGVLGRVGAEVFIARALSAHAHYGAEFGYRHTVASQELSDDQGFSATTEATQNAWQFGATNVTFGISLYF